jgi:alpha-ribazole phosphatase/probable phosphoglycerate mutase
MWQAVGPAAPWSRIVSSPLARCHAFALAVGDRFGLPVTTDERLKEVRFGVWEGRSRRQIAAEDPDLLRGFYHDPVANRPEGAEPLDVFTARVVAAWGDWVGAHGGEHTLMVVHAGVIRAVVAHILGIPYRNYYRINVENAGVTRVRLDPERPPQILFHAGCLEHWRPEN